MHRVPPAARRRILGAARRLGAEPGLRRAQELVTPWHVRRNRLDEGHLAAILAAALRPDANCIDVGANAGELLETVVRLGPAGRHTADEAPRARPPPPPRGGAAPGAREPPGRALSRGRRPHRRARGRARRGGLLPQPR